MSTEHLNEFLAAMAKAGCAPSKASDITPDDQKKRYHIEGDRPGTRNGSYQLKIDGDFAVGWFMSFRIGEVNKWNTRARRQLTAEEKAAYKARLEAEKKRREDALQRARSVAAAKAGRIWKRAQATGLTPYLARKGAELNGARVWKDMVVVPMYGERGIVSLQFIKPDGTKRFITDGQKEGAYFAIASRDEDKSVMVICEGFATGDAVRKATGLPVIVAFDAGNLKPVATVLRRKYPDSRFVIAADNDQWTVKPDGTRWNPGTEKAQQAAAVIGGAAVVWPDFASDDPDRRTDFNDLYLMDDGPEKVRERILGAIPLGKPQEVGGVASHQSLLSSQGDTPDFNSEAGNSEDWANEVIPLDAYDDDAREIVSLYKAGDQDRGNDWREKLFCKEDGKVHPKSLGNARLFLENDKVLSHLFCYDEFSHEKIVYQCPPWEAVGRFKPRALNDDDMTFLTCELEKRGIIQPIGTVSKLVNATIKNNSRNPAVEYFNRLVWDGVPRLDKWLTYYCGAEKDEPEYLRQIGRKWLTAAVKRVFEPGCKFDHLIVFEGPQNAGKSLMLKELATIHGNEYFDDTIKVSDMGNPSIVPKLQGVLIVEIAEMSGFRKKDVDELKQAITTTHDRIVKKYENEATRYPRQFVFAGTINPIDGYLHDPTGNRRFWPVRVGARIDIAALKRDKEQLWAEAVVRYKEREPLYLEDAVYELAQSAQKERNILHPWHPDLEELVDGQTQIAVHAIWEKLGIIDRNKRTRQAQDDISKIMTGLGFEQGRRRFEGELKYAWVRKQTMEAIGD